MNLQKRKRNEKFYHQTQIDYYDNRSITCVKYYTIDHVSLSISNLTMISYWIFLLCISSIFLVCPIKHDKVKLQIL